MGFVPDSKGASLNSTPSTCWECKKCWKSRLSHSEGENHDLTSVTSAPQLFSSNSGTIDATIGSSLFCMIISSKGRVPPFLGWCMRIYSELMGVCNTEENISS